MTPAIERSRILHSAIKVRKVSAKRRSDLIAKIRPRHKVTEIYNKPSRKEDDWSILEALPFEFLRVGVDPESPRDEQARVARVNVITFVSIALSSLYVIGYIVQGWWVPVIYNLFVFSSWLLVFWFHRNKRYRIAPRWCMVTGFAQLTGVTLLFFSASAGIHLYMLVILPFTFMTLHTDDRSGRLTLLVAAIILLALCESQPFVFEPPYRIPIGPASLRFIHACSVVLIAIFLVFICVVFFREREQSKRMLELQYERSEALLLSILPSPIAERLKQGEFPIADNHPSVTVLFADIVGFTEIASKVDASVLVELLARYFEAFDQLAARYDVEKIKTIGDGYMAASGVPLPDERSVDNALKMAQGMLLATRRINAELGQSLDLRIGLHVGDVTAGVIGEQKFIYDLWGDTVNVASRMESTGIPGAIQVTRGIVDRARAEFAFTTRDGVMVKGKGIMQTYLLRETTPASA